jgi:hypothetical protein
MPIYSYKRSRSVLIKTYCFILSGFFVNTIFAQNSPVVLSKKEALEDFKWLRFSLEYCHPRLYKFDDKKTVDARFDSVAYLIGDTISGLDFLKLVAVLNASVHCGHLYTIPQGNLEKEVLQKKVMPFYVKILDNKIYIINNCSDNAAISNGSEILSVNGKSSADLLGLMLPGIAADGYIETRKLRLIERYFFYSFHGFDLYYQLHVDRSHNFTIRYRDYKTKQEVTAAIQGISMDVRQKILKEKYGIDELNWFKTPSPSFAIKEKDNYAVLTISRSFYDPKIDPDYDSTLKHVFTLLRAKHVSNLIIDLRGNEGGSEHQESELISYLYPKPFKLYQHIYVSRLDYRPLKAILNTAEKDTSRLLDKNEDAWMRRINDNLWINNYDYYEGLQFQPAKKNFFQGNVYVLMNGTCFSSTSAMIANIKNTIPAKFIGEESGGLYEGPTGGGTVPIILPNSKIMVRISPNINIGYMYRKHPVGRGVFPDYTVHYAIDDVLANKDLEMEVAIKLIRTKK